MARKDKKDWDLGDLLSVVGFVFELLRVVVNALRKRGGTIEHLRRLLKEPDLVDKVFDLIVVKPAEAVKSILLTLIASTSSISVGRFVVQDHFRVDTSDSAEVKISYLGDNFKSWFLNLVETGVETVSLSCHTLLKGSLDGPIMEELGGESRVVVTMAVIWELLKAQRSGKSGILLTNGYANIFYVKDATGTLRAVRVYWGGDGWYVFAGSVTRPLAWHAGGRVFSRNS